MNGDIQKVVSRIKAAQKRLRAALEDATWVEEARRFAEKQGAEMKKLLSSDLEKVRAFLERERKELERFQKQIPGEVKKFRSFVQVQRKDFEKLLASLGRAGGKKGAPKKKARKAPSKAGGAGKAVAAKKKPAEGKAGAAASASAT